MPESHPITLLHLSDPQFGKNHRFAQQNLSAWATPFDTLLARLQEDLAGLRQDLGLEPDLLVVSGDLAEWGLKSEFESALRFLRGLCNFLKLPPSRVAIIPGNHDINRKLCESYFSECIGEERQPAVPYWLKWKPYLEFFYEFYRDTPSAEFTEDLPWSLFEVPDLKLVIAGLNSTMKESHLDEDHYGWVGEKQLQWFRDSLEPFRLKGWLRIGVVHHNFRRGVVRDDENLRDADDLQRILSGSLNLLFHGHTHEGKLDWIHPGLPILSTGSSALGREQRPAEVPNQYQIVRIWSDRICRWTRSFAPDRKSWMGDTRASADGSQWWDEQNVAFAQVQDTFPNVSEQQDGAPSIGTEADYRSYYKLVTEHLGRPQDDFLDRVGTICRLREPDSKVERITGTGAWGDYLRVCRHVGGIATIFPVGALEPGLLPESFNIFLAEVDARYRRSDPQLVSVLVYGGQPAPQELLQQAAAKRVLLQSFVEFQGLIDFRPYVARQTRKLGEDPIYPPSLYVAQRMQYQSGNEVKETADALATVQEWLASQSSRFLVLLGDFGTGKTFLLHELARRMGNENSGLVPILLQMRSLEKGRDLDSLLAQHFAQEGLEDFSPLRFRYMLEEGRIALLFDGFDELALRVTYQRATEHFDTLLQAATGAAKVVVTSRRQHFLSDQQVKTVLAERAGVVAGHRLAILQPFNSEQIQSFLRNYFGEEEKAKSRLRLIDRIKDLLGLSHNPRLLGFIAKLPEEQLLEAEQGMGDITAAKLYELILNQWLDLEFERVHPKGAPQGLSVEDRWRGVTALAMRLWQKTEGSVGLSELAEDAARVLEALRQAELDPEVAVFQLGSGTLLARDAEGNFSFLHQSVLEWLVAHQAAEELNCGQRPDSLGTREISPLMAEFLGSLAGKQTLAKWARTVLAGEATDVSKKNALLVLEHLREEAQETFHLAGQDLRGRDLSYQDLTGADLTGADLTGARLVETRLTAVSLREADLQNADLSGALLLKADLSHANLTGARLLGANLKGARLNAASLRRTKLLAIDIEEGALDGCDTFGAAFTAHQQLSCLTDWNWYALDLAWSEEQGLLATAEANVVRLWDTRTGREIRRLRGHELYVWCVAFNPQLDILATGSLDATIRLWELGTGRELLCLKGHNGGIEDLSFGPDGKTLASASDDRTIRLWDVVTGRELQRLKAHGDEVHSISFSPDGLRLASGSADNTIRLWEVSTGRELQRFHGHLSAVTCVIFNHAGQILASGSYDSTVRLWDIEKGVIKKLEGHSSWVNSIAFTPNDQLIASGSEDHTVRLWDVNTAQEVARLEGHKDGIRKIVINAKGTLMASCSTDYSVRFWDLNSGRESRRLQAAGNRVRDIATSPNGMVLISCSDDRSVRLWELKTGKQLLRFDGHEDGATAVSFDPNEEIFASGSFDQSIRLWNIHLRRETQCFRGHKSWIKSLEFSPDGSLLASGSDDTSVRLWDVASGEAVWIREHSKSVECVAFSPDGALLASGSYDSSLCLWQVSSGKLVRSIKEKHRESFLCVAFSPDGQILACGTHSHIRLRKVTSGREILQLEGHRNTISSLSFSPDGRILASASRDSSIRLWEVSSGREILRIQGHENDITRVIFCPDGRFLASCSYDSTIRLWDVSTGACLVILGLLPEGWVAFSPDGRYKLGGIPAGGFWHVINLCRFEAGELDDWIPSLRLPDDASFFDLQPWNPEVRRPASLQPKSMNDLDR